MSLFQELQRRNVIRVGVAYAVAAWLIIQVVETTFPYFGFSDNAIRIAIIVLGIGIAPAVVGAWVFQFTPGGIVLDKDARDAGASAQQSSRNFDRAIIVMLLVSVSYFAFDKFVLAPERSAEREAEVAEAAAAKALTGFYGDRSIAVLPFVNMSSDPEQEYFGDGIAEEVLNLLARIRELRVISRSSAFAFKGQDLDITDIAERLDVGHILEGSIRLSGNKVRVTAQLIEGSTDTHLWSQTYDRDLDDVFSIQDEIAADVVRNLKIELLSPLPKSRTVDPEVYALTQQAKQVGESRPDDIGRKMYGLLQQALEIDPDYVPALEWMITANYFRQREGLITPEEKIQLEEQILQQMLSLDPDNGFVDTARGFAAAENGNDKAAAAHYESALLKDATNSNSARLAGAFAIYLGKTDTAVKILRHATAIDPLCFQCLYRLSTAELFAGEYVAAERTRERYLVLGSGGHYFHGLMKLLQDDAEGARAAYEAMPEDRQQRAAGLAMAYYDLGELDKSQEEYERLLRSPELQEKESLLAQSSAWTGDSDQAFKWLRIMAEKDPWSASSDIFIPSYRNLHADPRWNAWRESVGMSAEYLDSIKFDPDLPE